MYYETRWGSPCDALRHQPTLERFEGPCFVGVTRVAGRRASPRSRPPISPRPCWMAMIAAAGSCPPGAGGAPAHPRLGTLLGPVSYTHLTLPTIYSV